MSFQPYSLINVIHVYSCIFELFLKLNWLKPSEIVGTDFSQSVLNSTHIEIYFHKTFVGNTISWLIEWNIHLWSNGNITSVYCHIYGGSLVSFRVFKIKWRRNVTEIFNHVSNVFPYRKVPKSSYLLRFEKNEWCR